MKKAVLVFAAKKPAAKEEAKKLLKWLKDESISFVDVSQTEKTLTEKELKGVTLAVVIGGDGTFLTLVRRLERKDQFPLMGINLGTLGFITEVRREQMLEAVQAALDNKYKTEKRRLMRVEVFRKGKCIESKLVFNDAVLTKDARTTMLKLEVQVGEEKLSDVRSDGYIIATPTGATAYALSAGGPLLHPDAEAYVLVPILSHSLSSRPVVVPQSLPVHVFANEFRGSVYLVYDGQVSFEILPGDEVRTSASDTFLPILRSPTRRWPETLRTKLGMA